MHTAEQSILKRVFERTPVCLPIETLAGLLNGSLSTDTLPAAQSHLEGCTFCRNELALLGEFNQAKPTDQEVEELEWVRRQVSARLTARLSQSSPAGRRTAKAGWATRLQTSLSSSLRSWRGFATVAVAAAALLVVVQVRNNQPARTSVAPGQEVWRSAGFAEMAPVGQVEAIPLKFRWSPVQGAARYQVRALRVDESEIWHGETNTAGVAIPAQVRSGVTPGRHLLWQVSAFGADGTKLSESSLQEFYLAPTR